MFAILNLPPMSETQRKDEFKIKFDGQLHQVEANTLINSLINISAILEESNTEIHPDEKIEIKIKALSEGSFLIHLLVEGVKNAQAMITAGSLATGANLITILTGLFIIKKHLSGKAPKNTKEENEKVSITNEKGNVLVIESLT